MACKLVPPVLGIVTMAIIYLAASRIFNRRVGLFSAFAWSAMLIPVFMGAAGYVDRDGLSILLVTIGALLFYLSNQWNFHIRNRNIGWLLAGLGVLAVEALLYIEWSFVGPVLLLAIILLYFIVRVLIGYSDRLQTETSLMRRIVSALTESNWRTFTVIVAGNALAALIYIDSTSFIFSFGKTAVQLGGESGVAEMQGISWANIIGYGFFLIPLAISLYISWRNRIEGGIFFSCWFLGLLFLSLFASRVLLYAAPAAALLVGLSLGFIWDRMKQGEYQILKKTGVAVLLFILFAFSFIPAYTMGSNPLVAANQDWVDATTYIRENTPEDVVIMTQWGWGYWILDLAQRKPVVDNGFYGWDYPRLHNIGKAYTTSDPAEAAQIMDNYNADYLVFSDIDNDFARTIMNWAGLGEKYEGYDGFPRESLIAQSLNGQFTSGGGLKLVYPTSLDAEVDYEVVILERQQHAEP
jgi:asparagine N-glycosylation enzyme membrane subunit Stt3